MRLFVLLLFSYLNLTPTDAAENVKPVAESRILTTSTPGFQESIKADITGARNLYLVVSDGGNGYGCDWADWVNPRLSGPGGELSLTKLKWKSATAEWGEVSIGRNAGGGPLQVNGKPVADGIGTHANSVIHFEIPEGYTTFTATAALDNGGTDQGESASVKFAVYTQKPAAASGPSTQDRSPESAVSTLDVAEGLEATLFAAEPLLLSPSNIDVDHLGRVWVCEVVNYRHFANKNNPAREEGDRILVLEDTDGDGTADKQTTFYQGRDIDSAHGVCVLGNRVIVSVGENVFNFYDDDGDLKADRKQVMFTGIKGTQHDHGIHSFTFGPDGRLYFNFGNSGYELHTPDGKLVVDVAGNDVIAHRKPYQEGMAFRCELDGSAVDTLGWNFRNNWELCVDSFGSIWQSDNDDDGNRGVRINFVMEYGNYGYKDEFTGAGWREPRTGWETDIPHRHWHLNDPGVVPNLLQTGAGSPTGIICYEGSLLPKRFVNQLIHCDAGPNVVRSYSVSNKGAGYSADINNILEGSRDQWFRPSDVCVAPDGSLIVADWYDPGVGGHRQGDIQRGRLFRVAPPDSKYEINAPDFKSLEGAAVALRSPNVATRFLAFQKLHSAGAEAEPVLSKLAKSDPNPRFRARAFWLLGQIDGKTDKYVAAAIADENPNIRITGLRIARRMNANVAAVIASLANDDDVQVRRECAIALRHVKSSDKPTLWATLAAQLPSHDRWYLEALGIAADGQWDECLAALARRSTPNGAATMASMVWRSRGSESAKLLVDQIISFASVSSEASASHIPAFFRALDFQPKEKVSLEIKRLLNKKTLTSFKGETSALVISEALQRLGSLDFSSDPESKAALELALKTLEGSSQFIRLVEQFQLEDRYADVLKMAQQNPSDQIGVEAVRTLLRLKKWNLLTAALNDKSTETAVATALVMGNSLENSIGGPIMAAVKDASLSLQVRREAVRAAAKVRSGAQQLAQLVETNKLDPSLTQAVAAALHASPSRATREIAAKLFPLPAVKEGKPLPPISTLVTMKGDTNNGRLIFNTTGTCHKCHKVNQIGKELGPDLTEIGSKLSRHAMFESIIFPSAGISHNYEGYTLLLENGTTVSGLITSDTDEQISIKGTDLIVRSYAKSEVEEMVKQTVSIMPADLQKVMTVQEIVDVVDYLQTLKKK